MNRKIMKKQNIDGANTSRKNMSILSFKTEECSKCQLEPKKLRRFIIN